MSIAPGRKKGKFFRDLATDLQTIRSTHHIDVIVTLLRNSDMEDLRINDMLAQVNSSGMESLHFPIRDKWIPSSMKQFMLFVDEVVERIRAGKRILVHCNGGKGRTATLVVCCLIALGYEVHTAIEITRKARHGTIRNPLQIFYVYQFKQKWEDQFKWNAEDDEEANVEQLNNMPK